MPTSVFSHLVTDFFLAEHLIRHSQFHVTAAKCTLITLYLSLEHDTR